MKRFVILGSTGSIGTSSLDVIASNPDHFMVAGLAASNSADIMCEQVRKFRPEAVAMSSPGAAEKVRSNVGSLTRVYEGFEGMLEMIREIDAEAVINGLVGSVGLVPTLSALENGKDVLLANKETIVMGGNIAMDAVKSSGRRIVPIDSEMSAVYQCLKGENRQHVKRLILTASGGPFVDYSLEQLRNVTVEQALNHPTWSMGTKNTVDSATLMNKGLEVIEARYLFDIPGDRIDITIHRSSVAHSLVEFVDGSILAQISEPDMRLAIQYAMTDSERLPSPYGSLDFTRAFSLTFEPPDTERFPCLGLAYEALDRGGTAPAALNGANEQAVHEFVNGNFTFKEIPEAIKKILEQHRFVEKPTVEELGETDMDAKRQIRQMVNVK
ncbi:MAG: 1-deoxy-D-xylulose-5-phosphate reductoisomerase [Candidatus Latescibacteria bacterium]|nr:1-deoxy-D-xylulose-5-phosphate reductoisomerase [Candidatus Latescibacterota bacterium]